MTVGEALVDCGHESGKRALVTMTSAATNENELCANVAKRLRNRWPYAAVAVGAAAFFFLHLFRLSGTPIWHTGDAAIYLEHAERMLHGAVLYRDIFEFNLPGTEWLYLLAFRCVGVHLWVPNMLLLVAGTGVTVLAYALARAVLRPAAAALAAFAYLLVCQRSSIDGAHHWYSTLFVLAAANVIIRTRHARWMVLAGTLLGVATVFTSTRGAAAAVGVVVFLLWSDGARTALRPTLALLAAFCAPVAATLGYLAMRVNADMLWYALIVFPLHYYGKGAANSFSVYFDEWHGMFPLHAGSVLLGVLWIALNLMTPLLLVVWTMRLLRTTGKDDALRRKGMLLLVCAGMSTLVVVASAPSAPRLNCAAAFAYVLGAALVQEASRPRTARVLLAVLLVTYSLESAVTLARPVYVVHGPRGAVGFLDRENYEAVGWLSRQMREGDGYFGWPMVNWTLGAPNPSAIEWVEPNGYTRPEQVQALIGALEREKTRFVDPVEDAAEPRDADDSLEPLRAYLKTHYHVGHTYSDGGTVLERNGASAVRQIVR